MNTNTTKHREQDGLDSQGGKPETSQRGEANKGVLIEVLMGYRLVSGVGVGGARGEPEIQCHAMKQPEGALYEQGQADRQRDVTQISQCSVRSLALVSYMVW